MAAHIHHELMKQYAEEAATTDRPWELWECRQGTSNWETLQSHPGWFNNTEYRRKPRTIKINGFDVPEPCREAPSTGEEYWCVSTGGGRICVSLHLGQS